MAGGAEGSRRAGYSKSPGVKPFRDVERTTFHAGSIPAASTIRVGLPTPPAPIFIGPISGVASVGPNGGRSPMSVTVPFQMPFNSPPVVIANALQGTDYGPGRIPDTFAVTITSVSNTQFTANVYRVDANGVGWGQNLQLGGSPTRAEPARTQALELSRSSTRPVF